jgi:hypothetical protein
MISNGGGFKSTFAERDKKQTLIDLIGILTNWFKNQLCPSIKLTAGSGDLHLTTRLPLSLCIAVLCYSPAPKAVGVLYAGELLE